MFTKNDIQFHQQAMIDTAITLSKKPKCPNCGAVAYENAYGTTCNQWPLCGKEEDK